MLADWPGPAPPGSGQNAKGDSALISAARLVGRRTLYYGKDACRASILGISALSPGEPRAGFVVRHLIDAGEAAPVARVTVVNDSPDFIDMMGELLKSLGHEMVGLRAVGTSITDLTDSKPKLLIVDLRLDNQPQEISGWELLVLARSHRHLNDVPVILCTADVWELKKRAADLEQIAGVHVRTKPFDVDEMCALIQRLVNEPRVADSRLQIDANPSAEVS
jgi:CheY-like chemotaxis protein